MTSVDVARRAGVDAVYAELDSPHGHDAFLIESDQLGMLLRPFVARLEASGA